MKLVKQGAENWQYLLNPMEMSLLRNLVNKFPFTGDIPVKITKTDRNPKVVEREKLLNESLVEHRRELKRQAADLLGDKKFRKSEKDYRLTLTSGDRETLLQILNDIRVSCWVLLGKPESLELPLPSQSALDLAHQNLMNLAGYFEHHLVDQN